MAGAFCLVTTLRVETPPPQKTTDFARNLGVVGKNAVFAPQNDAARASRHSLGVCGNAAESGANPSALF